jgi:hypothetical protein
MIADFGAQQARRFVRHDPQDFVKVALLPKDFGDFHESGKTLVFPGERIFRRNFPCRFGRWDFFEDWHRSAS